MGFRKATEEELEKMESTRVIEKVERTTEWFSEMVVAPKSNNQVRICVDLMRLNKSVKRDSYSLPRLEETLSSLEGSRYFSKMDADSIFHQIRLSEESKEYTQASPQAGHKGASPNVPNNRPNVLSGQHYNFDENSTLAIPYLNR